MTAEATDTVRERSIAEPSALRPNGEFPRENLKPLLEGARARGIADAFDLMGQAAVFLDGSGTVLHLTRHAETLIAGDRAIDLTIVGGHLVGESGSANQRLGALIGAALCEDGPPPSEIEMAGASGAMRIRAVRFPDGRDNPFQLLKAILLIDTRR